MVEAWGFFSWQKLNASGDPNGNRTRVARMKTWCPRPLDDGASFSEQTKILLYYFTTISYLLVISKSELGDLLTFFYGANHIL